ncbi:MAG: carbohydrate-binding domain-containing protein [Clostridiales bacterium]|nr:carbohydrate-binding domain-containing protein [Clostridiales bacterium]
MKKTYILSALVLVIILPIILFTSCTSESGNESTASAESQTSTAAASSSAASVSEVNTDGSTRISLNKDSVEISGNGATADGSVITVSSGGTYTVSGTLPDGRIIVDADGEEVTLVLSGADISCSYSSAIYVYEAKSAIIYLAEGTDNKLSDGSSYTYNDSYSSEADEEPNACIYSKDDLTLAGSGSLTVNGNLNNGITGKDTLLVESVNLTVNAKNTAIKGKDDLTINSGSFTIDCEGDAVHGDSNTTINSGSFEIKSGDDGIHADNTVTINGGTINIDAHEGIEGTIVIINDGKTTISADDDGINASQKIDGITPKVEINGGEITISMAQGDTDGIDSNGDIAITGGTVNVNGQSPFDYVGTGSITGGSVYSNGSQITELSNQFDGQMGGPGAMGGQPPQGDNNGQMPQPPQNNQNSGE